MAEPKQLPKKPPQIKPVVRDIKNITDRKGKFIIALLIFISCFVLYGNTIPNSYALDDGIYTNKNDFIIKGFPAFKDIFDKGSLFGFDKNPATQYRPLTLLNFMTEVSIFGLNPHVSHFFNILFYAFTVVLLYFFLNKVLRNYNHAIIIAATLLFVFHPIHTEVVANIKSRDEILGLLFGMVSFYCIIIYTEKDKIKYFIYSLLAFSIAVFCKENCLTFVLIIPLLLYFFTSVKIKKIVLVSIPFLGADALYLFIRSIVLSTLTFIHHLPVMDNALMSSSNSADISATSILLPGKYIYMTIIPYPLSWDYSYDQIPIVSWANYKAIISSLVCIVMIGFMFWRFGKKSLFSFLIAFFFITLLLSSNLIIKIASTFGERFLYVPSLSFCIGLPVIISKALGYNPLLLVWRNKAKYYIPIICLLLVYSLIVIPRNHDWKNNYTLFSAGIFTSPNSARTHLLLAQEYGEELQNISNKDEQQKLFSMDIQQTRVALTIYNKYPEAYYNLGVLYFSEGLKDSALRMFQKALEVKPNYAQAANNIGIIYAQKSDYDNAVKWFATALNTDTALPGLFLNIGNLYQKTGDVNKAAYYYNRGLQINPEDSDIKNNLFVTYYNSGKDCFNRNDYTQALKFFTTANKYNANSAEVTGYLGAIYQSGGNYAKAEEYYKKSLSIDPNNLSVQHNLEMVIQLQKGK